MKICPKCQQTYTDETLNFCLNDGSNLVQDAANDLPQTVMIQPPRQTNPGQGLGNQSAQTEQNQGFGSQSPQFGSPNQSQNSWNAPQQPQSFGQQPSSMIPPKQKSSKSWIWVLGILGGLIVLCGGGFGILVLIGLNTDEPRIQNSANNTSTSPTPKNLTKYDLSSWKTETDEFATTKYEKGVFTIETIRDDYYYVVVTKDLKTQDKITKVTVKNVDAKPVAGGFGLIVHS